MAEEEESQDLLTPFEIIFSCSICQATVRNVYHDSPREGLNDGRRNGPAPRLWLAECGHVSCGEHFEGGGPPFHPDNEAPRAPCPMCIADDGHSSLRRLFCITKDAHKNHDDAIPTEFFETPPIQLDNRGPPGMQALRFQYLQLARYGIMVTKKLEDVKLQLHAELQQAKPLLQANRYLEQKAEALQRRIKELEAVDQESKAMTDRIKELEVIEKKYKAYKEREPEIKHYLNAFTTVTKENGLLKEQLLTLGYEVPQNSYSMKPQIPNGVLHTTKVAVDQPMMTRRRQNNFTSDQREKDQYATTGSSRTLSRPVAAPPMTRNKYPMEQNFSGSGRKRGHREYVNDALQQAVLSINRHHNKDDESMSPPPKPVNHRVATPQLVTELAERVESNGRGNESVPVLIVETFDNRRWRETENVPLGRQTADRQRKGEIEAGQYIMSGALRPKSPSLNGRVADISINEAPLEPLRRIDELPPRGAREEPWQGDELQDMPFLKPLQPQLRTANPIREPNFIVRNPRVEPDFVQQSYATNAASLPVRASSRSSTLRQHAATTSRRQAMIPEFCQQVRSTYAPLLSHQVRNSAYNFPQTPRAPRMLNQYDRLSTRPAISPFFNGQVVAAPQYCNYDGNILYTRASSPSRVATAAKNFQMQPTGTGWAPNRSLNSLSFMQNAYTPANEPIFNSASRRPTAYGSRPIGTNAVVTNIRGAKSGGPDLETYSGRSGTNAYMMNGYGSKYPAPTRRLFSAAGRRTVRR